MNPMVSVIIVAAGKGTRMGPDVDKLFLEVAGLPVVVHTWARFDSCPCIDEIVVVVREGMAEAFSHIAVQNAFKKPCQIIAGGKERQDSVWNGLEALSANSEIVAIQDGARPCATHKLIEATVQAARETGAAVAAQKITDTIKESTDGAIISRTVDRARLWSVQTPQTFRVEVIRRALTTVRAQGIQLTDDTAACEFIGQPVRLIEGDFPNPKVTVSADLPYIEHLLRQLA